MFCVFKRSAHRVQCVPPSENGFHQGPSTAIVLQTARGEGKRGYGDKIQTERGNQREATREENTRIKTTNERNTKVRRRRRKETERKTGTECEEGRRKRRLSFRLM